MELENVKYVEDPQIIEVIPSKIKILFEGSDEVLKVVKNEGSLVDILGFPDEKRCQLMGSEITIAKKLGEGVQGAAFEISTKDPIIGTRSYVVKKTYMRLQKLEGSFDRIGRQLEGKSWNNNRFKHMQSSQSIQNYERAKTNKNILVELYLPAARCRLDKDEEFAVRPYQKGGPDFINIHKGAYLCSKRDNSFSEFIIGVYVAKLYSKGLCINFFNVYSTFICTNESTKNVGVYDQYIFMDKIDKNADEFIQNVKENNFNFCTSLGNFISMKEKEKKVIWGCNGEEVVDATYVQTIFAIAMFQNVYNISHNDLHLGNVFVEFVTKDTSFNGKKLSHVNWYEYRFKGKSIYIPATPLLVKIGDYGYAIKYSTPVVGPRMIFEDNYPVSNYFIPSYDALYFSCSYLNSLDHDEGTLLINSCFYALCPKVNRMYKNTLSSLKEANYVDDKLRPILQNLKYVNSALDLLEGPIYETYKVKPIVPDNQICLIGTFD